MPARAIDLDRSLFGGVLPRLGTALARTTLALWRQVRRRPLDSLAGAVALVAAGAIVANAMFLQAAFDVLSDGWVVLNDKNSH